jgi:glucokinase
MNKYIMGVDIGGSHIVAALIDRRTWEVVEGSEINLFVDCQAGMRTIMRRWSRAVWKCLREVSDGCDVGIAMPGPFDYERGIALFEREVRKFGALRGIDVGAELRRRVRRIDKVRFVNDASAFALGEVMAGAGNGAGRVMALTLGTGFGSSFVVNGTIVNSGDEVPPDGYVYNMPFDGSIADDEFSTRWFIRRYHELTGNGIAGAQEVFDRMEQDGAARQIVEEYGLRLAEFIAPIYARFRGDVVVFGGNIARSFELFAPSLTRRLAEMGATIEIRRAQLFDRAALIGAASLFK